MIHKKLKKVDDMKILVNKIQNMNQELERYKEYIYMFFFVNT